MCLMPQISHHPIASLLSPCHSSEFSQSLPDSYSAYDTELTPQCDYIDPATPCLANETGLRVMQYNIRGLVNKQDDLMNLLTSRRIDIALLFETWLNDQNVNRVDIPGYNFVFHNREHKSGGGVAIFIKDTLKI